MRTLKRCLLVLFVAVLSIAGTFVIPGTRWIGSKTLELQLPPGTTLSQASFYECFCTLDEVIASRTTDDFRRVDSIANSGDDTVMLRLTITSVDYPMVNWCDSRTEPTFIITVIQNPAGLVNEKLIAQNSPDRQTSIAVAIPMKP